MGSVQSRRLSAGCSPLGGPGEGHKVVICVSNLEREGPNNFSSFGIAAWLKKRNWNSENYMEVSL